ncbi:MAG: potassium transporter TrkA [Sulfurospirillum sp.]|nr:potassium transporter TrkA [Sulfurospirillum sp.]MBL0702610.1 potassium transporter TrkA [Sulfurospirillum sp.]
MKKILIIADGILAKHFLESVMNNTNSDNFYDVVAYRDKTVPLKKLENFTFHNFDPTSFKKLSLLVGRGYHQIMIIVSKKIDAVGVYDNIRALNKEVQIILLNKWVLEFDDSRLKILSSRDILSSRFVDFLPNMPVVAQNVGLGIGEIMEIKVPIGSSYVYRHLASIVQKKWKISGIYRANSFVLPRPTLMIQPNDIILAVGDPIVLQSVYRSIKSELGQFPAPFGSSIYCLVNMLDMSSKEIDELVNDALLLHSKISSMKLHIKIINSTCSETFNKLKSYGSNHISVEIDYYNRSVESVMKEDLSEKDIGLIVVTNEFFISHMHLLYQSKLPVLKMGIFGFSNLTEGVVLSNSHEDIEKESTVIFDLCAQLNLNIKLYNFNPDNLNKKNSLAEHFYNLSKLFNQKVEIINENSNPLLKLRYRDDILQFVPFHNKIIKTDIFSAFSTDMEKLSFKLADSYQLFIPMHT